MCWRILTGDEVEQGTRKEGAVCKNEEGSSSSKKKEQFA